MATEKFGLLCYATGPAVVTPTAAEVAAGHRLWLPEIHLNVWERDDSQTKEGEAFLDVGLMFDMKEPATTIELIFRGKYRIRM